MSAGRRYDGQGRLLLGGALILGPLLYAVGGFVRPAVDWSDPTAAIETAVDNAGLWQLGMGLTIAGLLLLVPTAIATGQLVRDRKPRLASAGTIMFGTGAMVIGGWNMGDLRVAGAEGLDAADIALFAEQAENLPAVLVLMSVGMLSFLVGGIVLAVGLWRSRATPAWVPAVLAASMILAVLAIGGVVSGNLQAVVMALGFLGVALSYFSGSGEIGATKGHDPRLATS